jgi:hypothetical protein
VLLELEEGRHELELQQIARSSPPDLATAAVPFFPPFLLLILPHPSRLLIRFSVLRQATR